jgi:ABC-2 type transport system ATP-binding protein
VRELPGGYRQHLAHSPLLLRPPVVFLAETGVDPEARRRFWDLIDELSAQGTTVFVTTHYMDEAERCHRVALMHAGRLLALDTLPGLKSRFPAGTVLEIDCPQPAQALARLEELPGVSDAALFGDRLHAVVDDPARGRGIEAALAEAGFSPVTTTPIAPSLEDVFIRAIREASREGVP